MCIVSSASHIPHLVFVVVTWTIVSFCCYWCCEHYLSVHDISYGIGLHVLILSFAETMACVIATKLIANKDKEITALVPVLVISHFFALLTTNCSLAQLDASATMTLKFTEPIVTAVVLFIFFDKSLPRGTWLSLAVVVVGSIGFAGNPFQSSATLFGTAMVLLSNICFALRNIAAKNLLNDADIQLRCTRDLCLLGLPALSVIVFVSAIHGEFFEIFTPANKLTWLSAGAVVTHVAYTYLSVCYALKAMSVLSHAIASILTRIFLVLLFMLLGSNQHQFTFSNASFLTMAIIGLVMYSREELRFTAEHLTELPSVVNKSHLQSAEPV